MRGQPERLSQDYLRRLWRERHFICFGFVSYERCFLHSQTPSCATGLSFVFLLVWLFIILPFIRFYRVKVKQNLTATSIMTEFIACVIILCSFLCPLFSKVHKTTTWNSHILYTRETVNCTTMSYIFCLGYFWQCRQAEWIQILVWFIAWILRWNSTLYMDQKVCLNLVKKDQLCAIALMNRNEFWGFYSKWLLW